MRGVLIVLEGIDGSGKSTASRGLAEALRAEGLRVELTVEPTKSWLGEIVRRGIAEDLDPYAEAFLFMADHAAHVLRVRALLDEGVVVISDRWSDSTHAYQGVALAGRLEDPVGWLTSTGAPSDLRPDAVLLLDIPLETALERLEARGLALEKFERAAVLEQVAANYARLASERGYVRIDATRDPEEVAEACAAAARRLLRRHGML